MKYLNYLSSFTLIVLIFSCKNFPKIENGIYTSKNNDQFYAIDIDNSENQIKFFILNSYSTKNPISQEIFKSKLDQAKNSDKDYKSFSKGNYKIDGNKMIIENLESDMLPSSRPKILEAKIFDGQILMDCEVLSKYITGNSIGCESKEIIFIKKQ